MPGPVPASTSLETIAYWVIEKSAHSSRLRANINKIAQVAIDLSVKNGRPALKILKAEKRNSKFLNEAQAFSCEGTEASPGRTDQPGERGGRYIARIF